MRFLVIVGTLLLSACSHQPELFILVGPRVSEGIQDPLAVTILLMQRYGNHGINGCVHGSVFDKGEPFNEREEITFDQCGTGVRWGGNKK